MKVQKLPLVKKLLILIIKKSEGSLSLRRRGVVNRDVRRNKGAATKSKKMFIINFYIYK